MFDGDLNKWFVHERGIFVASWSRMILRSLHFQVDTIAKELEYIPADYQLYSSTGCKKVQHKVQQYLHGGVSEEEDEDSSEEDE